MSAGPATDASIRRAGSADADAVQACVQVSYARWVSILGHRPIPAERDYHATIREQDVWVLERGGTVAAVLGLILGDDEFLIDNIAVHPDHHRRGIGSRLLGFAETQASRLGYPVVRLYTNAKMIKNIAWYRRRGYRVVERRRMQHKVAVFMEKAAP